MQPTSWILGRSCQWTICAPDLSLVQHILVNVGNNVDLTSAQPGYSVVSFEYFLFPTFWLSFLFAFDPCVFSLLCLMLHLQMGDESEPVTTWRERVQHFQPMSGHDGDLILSLLFYCSPHSSA